MAHPPTKITKPFFTLETLHSQPLVLYCEQPDRIPTEDFRALMSLLPEALQQRILRFHRWQDAQASLIGRLLLLEGFLRMEGSPMPSLHDLQYTSYGRPYLAEGPHFNISHSETMVVCALNHSHPLGIDVEFSGPLKLDDFSAFMTPAERETITNSQDSQLAFYTWWTKKEACVKADGMGLSIPIEEIVLKDNRAQVSGKDSYHLYPVALTEQYIAHMATPQVLAQAPSPVAISIESLLQHAMA